MRMRRFRGDADEAQVDMTPMLDIVFIMLIFFIVTTSFIKPTGLDYDKLNSTIKTKSKSENILIDISKNGMIKMDDRYVDMERLTANIERKLAENPEAMALIKADSETLHGVVVEAMDKVKIAGVEKISVSN